MPVFLLLFTERPTALFRCGLAFRQTIFDSPLEYVSCIESPFS